MNVRRKSGQGLLFADEATGKQGHASTNNRPDVHNKLLTIPFVLIARAAKQLLAAFDLAAGRGGLGMRAAVGIGLVVPRGRVLSGVPRSRRDMPRWSRQHDAPDFPDWEMLTAATGSGRRIRCKVVWM